MNRIKEIWPKWEGVEILGEGGFGTVYKAKKDSFAGEEFCAVKIIKIPNNKQEVDEMMSSGFTENNVKEYFHKSALNLVDEIKMMQKMKAASHIVSIEDYEVIENTDHIGYTILIRMELLTNITKYFKTKEITVSEVVKMAADILTALEFCHSQNIMHRDIKPANIFISEFGEYKLGDFGISKEVEKTNATLSQKGTKSYMAPEMIRMEKYGKNVDLYALGLTMYELLNKGRMPFLPPYPQSFYPQQREEAILKRLSGQVFPNIDGIGDLNAIIKKACHPNKQERYQSASEMKKDLLSLNLENKTLPQETYTNEVTQSLFNNEATMGLQSSFEEKTVGVFDDKPKNEFMFEDTIIKLQPKPEQKVKSQPKVVVQSTPKAQSKPASVKSVAKKESLSDKIDKALDNLKGGRKVVVGLVMSLIFVVSVGLSLIPICLTFVANTAKLPVSIVLYYFIISIVMLLAHQKLLKGKQKEGIWLFLIFPTLVTPLVGYILYKNPFVFITKSFTLVGATTMPQIFFYNILFFAVPWFGLSIVIPIKNRFWK